jgi:hypothetical protein
MEIISWIKMQCHLERGFIIEYLHAAKSTMPLVTPVLLCGNGGYTF